METLGSSVEYTLSLLEDFPQMTNIICAQCNFKFPNSETLEEHLLSNHATPGEPIDSPPPAPPVNAKDFEETMKLIEADKVKKQAELDKIRAKHKDYVSPPVEKKPLVLEYRYSGQAECGHDVATLMVEAGDRLYATAFCVTCNKQIQSLAVSQLPQWINIENDILPKKSKKDV